MTLTGFPKLPFRLGTTSYIIPDDILPNVRYLADKIDDIELVLFDVEDYCNLPSPALVAEAPSRRFQSPRPGPGRLRHGFGDGGHRCCVIGADDSTARQQRAVLTLFMIKTLAIIFWITSRWRC